MKTKKLLFMTLFWFAAAVTVTFAQHNNQIEVNGKRQTIFPNQIDRDNYLTANTEFGIPDFVLGAPYGQESMAGIVGGRGLSIRDGRAKDATGDASAYTRFIYTILQPGSETETLIYEKPGDMREFIQTMRTEIQSRGGRFNGNEWEGSFSEAGIQGTYRVSGNNIIFTIRQEWNTDIQPSIRQEGPVPMSSTAVPRSSMGCYYAFSFDKPRNVIQAVNAAKTKITQKGGRFYGDERAGGFQASGITGEYNIVDKVEVTIIDKPRVIPNSMIENEVKKFFGAR
jgi:hypothetical protein